MGEGKYPSLELKIRFGGRVLQGEWESGYSCGVLCGGCEFRQMDSQYPCQEKESQGFRTGAE